MSARVVSAHENARLTYIKGGMGGWRCVIDTRAHTRTHERTVAQSVWAAAALAAAGAVDSGANIGVV